MSDVFYPLSLISKLKVTPIDRTLRDDFEDGSTSTRRMWAAQAFKRRVELTHSPLTPVEFRYLRSFYSARGGMYDSFWFRDNVNRDGNMKVRFSKPVSREYLGRAAMISLELEETAPVRALPEQEDMLAAAGSLPVVWWDANREIYYTHAGTAYTPENTQTWDAMEAFRGTWTGGTLDLGGLTAQNQSYKFDGTRYCKSGNLSAMNGLTAATIFCQANIASALSSKMVLCFGTATTAGKLIGLYVNAANFWVGYIGGVVVTTNTFANAATWRSAALTISGTTAKLYWNGNLVGSETLGSSLSLITDVMTVGALNTGSQLVPNGSQVSNALLFGSALSDAQIAAVHNLTAAQQGLALV